MSDAGLDRCELCTAAGGELLWRGPICRIVLVNEPGYPGYCRVIAEKHVKEMSDLAPAERVRLMQAVFAAESALRALLSPDKMNLASLGNLVPHLHWHVIARWRDDRHFPAPIWAAPARESAPPRARPERAALERMLKQELG